LTGETVADFVPRYEQMHILEEKFNASQKKIIEFDDKNKVMT